MPKVKTMLEVSSEELHLYVPVIVTMWKHKNFGRGKRAWLKEFTEKERKKISDLYREKWYRWYLVSGYPQKARMTIKTFDLMARTANFFGGL